MKTGMRITKPAGGGAVTVKVDEAAADPCPGISTAGPDETVGVSLAATGTVRGTTGSGCLNTGCEVRAGALTTAGIAAGTATASRVEGAPTVPVGATARRVAHSAVAIDRSFRNFISRSARRRERNGLCTRSPFQARVARARG
jgi:hypothetical protein